MSTGKVDSKKRIVLPNARTGDIYEIRQEEDRLVLVRLRPPEPKAPLSREACLAAMEQAPLRPVMPWEELRALTREP